jgi:O-6-methylguanine DNA methyltransferase
MDRIDASLRDLFAASAPPGLADRLRTGLRKPALDLEPLASQFSFHATDRGVSRLEHRRGADTATARGRRHAQRAREELREYLAGDRSFFSVAVDLQGVPPFQARVLDEAARIPFGDVTSYAELARRIGHPRAARAVGNALGANPVPVIVPCHRIIRGDGTWGHYAFGAAMKTRLLTLERTIPALVGSALTRIVCRHGCPAEQRVAQAQRIVFASVADARSVGYRACRVCRPT